MIKKFFILIGLIASSNVFAQADEFSGFSVGLNTGLNTEVTRVTITSGSDDFRTGTNNTPLNLDLGYAFSLGTNTVLNIGADYALTNSTIYPKDLLSATKDFSLKSHYAINLEPGVVVNDKLLAYLKISYHGGKFDAVDINKNINGVGYGFGFKYMLDKNLYINLAAQQVNYSKVSVSDSSNTYDITLKSHFSTIGLGYKF